MRIASLLLGVFVLAAIVVGAFLVLFDQEKPSAEEQATIDALERQKLRLDPALWQHIEAQPWFDKGKTTPDGMRLVNLIAEYFYNERPFNAVEVLRLYPGGLAAEAEQILLSLKLGPPIRTVIRAPWFLDGVDANEKLYLELVGAAVQRNWSFDEFLLDLSNSRWFGDGIDEKEIAVVSAGAALSTANPNRAMELIRGLESDLFLYDKLGLPTSGEKVLIVTAASRNLEGRLRPALDLVRQWAARVEAFAGPYRPQHIVVSVAELDGALCGIGSAQDADVPGVVTLHLDCIQDRTVIHELAHVFTGVGPTWFTEGVADLVVFHVTGRLGSYLSRQTTGKIELNARRGPGGLGSPEYINQAGLGAKLLLEVYRLLGPEQTSAAVKQMTTVEWPREGRALLDSLLASTPDNLKPRVNALIAERFEAAR